MAKDNQLKVFISVDMEGITGVIHWDEVDLENKAYDHFREIMIGEANAAIEGALEAGATEIVVRDSHGSARNLLPGKLHPKAQLIREWAGSPYSMMEGIDETFDAVCFVGYHAAAGIPDATLKHTMSGRIYHLKVNGDPVPEAGWNALIAGYYDVPVVFLSGDKAICEYAQNAFRGIHTVAVKEGIGKACKTLHPDVTQTMIASGVTEAVINREKCVPFTLAEEYFAEIEFVDENKANVARWYPGAERTGHRTVGLRSSDFMDCLRFYLFTS